MIVCNIVAPQFLWSKRIRTSLWGLWIVAVFVNVGMWFERFVIIITSLAQDFLPSSWGMFYPTWVDYGMLIGSFGLFFTMFLLFLRFLPVAAMAEIKTVMPQAHAHSGPGGTSLHEEQRSDYWPDEGLSGREYRESGRKKNSKL